MIEVHTYPSKEQACSIEWHSSPAPAGGSAGPCALALCRAGCDIVVASPEIEKNEEVAGEIRACSGAGADR